MALFGTVAAGKLHRATWHFTRIVIASRVPAATRRRASLPVSSDAAGVRRDPSERRYPVKYDEFIEAVSQRANIPPDEAVVLTRATLETLSERISGGEARDLAAQLPRAMQAALLPVKEHGEQFRIEEFVRRVSERAVIDTPLAWEGARAVITTLRDAVTLGEFDDIMAQLPKDYRELVTPVSRWSAGPQI
jgi:uncharacterized protein (DUF2267 family)